MHTHTYRIDNSIFWPTSAASASNPPHSDLDAALGHYIYIYIPIYLFSLNFVTYISTLIACVCVIESCFKLYSLLRAFSHRRRLSLSLSLFIYIYIYFRMNQRKNRSMFGCLLHLCVVWVCVWCVVCACACVGVVCYGVIMVCVLFKV